MSLRTSLVSLALTTALPIPAAAFAQDSSGSEEAVSSADEIIVTALRRDERLVDAPVAITAVTGETLNKYAATKLGDISTLVPSLIAGRAASGSSASIFLRGVGSTALSAGFDQSVSFVVDGMAMSRGREISLSQYDVKSIEVLNGPQALFFGKNSTGGLINITTNNPTDTFAAGLKAGYGFEAREKYGEGYISGPLSNTVRARLAFRASDSDGAYTNTAAATYLDPLGMPRLRNSDRRGGGAHPQWPADARMGRDRQPELQPEDGLYRPEGRRPDRCCRAHLRRRSDSPGECKWRAAQPQRRLQDQRPL